MHLNSRSTSFVAFLSLLWATGCVQQVPVAVRLSPDPAIVPMGLSIRITAMAELADGSVEPLESDVTWTSSNPSVADVTAGPASEVRVTAASMGSTTISIYSEETGFSAEAELQVKSAVLRPVAEFEEAGTLFFSSQFHFESRQIKEALLTELPADMLAIPFTASPSSVASVQSWAEGLSPAASFEAVAIEGDGNGFWARDALPIPVWLGTEESKELAVVDADYYHGYEPDAAIARGFGSARIELGYGYEGGNFVTDANGNCFAVQEGTAKKIPDAEYTHKLGCRTLTRLPYVGGIGHVDERVKFLSDSVVVTDTPSYSTLLSARGYDVRMLPGPASSSDMQTYVNSLLVNGTVFVPVFGDPLKNQQAIAVYESLGLRVVALDSRVLSNQGLGSIHCITATYPSQAIFDSSLIGSDAVGSRAFTGEASESQGAPSWDIPVTQASPARSRPE